MSWSMLKETGELLKQKNDEKILCNLVHLFSEITGSEIRINNGYGINLNNKWSQVNFMGKGIQLNIWFDKKYHYANEYYIEQRVIKICYFSVYPQGVGLGTKIIHTFLQEMNKTSFEKIILDSKESAVEFWRKMGFDFIQDSHFMSISLPYIKTNFKLTFNNKK
ncbi:hypothetical protein PAECIP111891_02174 [Paenibacillus allorhizoplanae]|uniref:N-acetyltransferase domain-containing protein n=1 Tax=Paenibacillus allorhizoplanae TaxID=2905648 RepID=A0ABM9C358_9BACL|nr:hypothetical protein [Paenibacillus allorhizoplanae]CAH1202964.1 hypothetical protein PAECIP111891_02174 [Paenibacillus allorhizoplanae]